MQQLGFKSEVTPQEVAREQSLGGAIDLCARAAGLTGKEVQSALGLDKAQWSRWLSGQEGITWAKLTALMDLCGNDAPLLWMLMQRNYDLASLRHAETELERKLREANDRIATMVSEREVERRLFRDLRVSA